MNIARLSARSLLDLLINIDHYYHSEILLIYDFVSGRCTFLKLFLDELNHHSVVNDIRFSPVWRVGKNGIINQVEKLKNFPRYRFFRDRDILRKLSKSRSEIKSLCFELIENGKNQ